MSNLKYKLNKTANDENKKIFEDLKQHLYNAYSELDMVNKNWNELKKQDNEYLDILAACFPFKKIPFLEIVDKIGIFSMKLKDK